MHFLSVLDIFVTYKTLNLEVLTTTTNQSDKTKQILLLIAITFILYVLKPLIIPLLLAVIFSVFIFPMQKKIEKKWKCNRLFSAIFSISLFFIVSIFLILFLSSQLSIFIEDSNIYVAKIIELYTDTIVAVEDFFNIRKSQSLLNKDMNFSNFLKKNIGKVSAIALEWGTVVTDLILIPIYMFFFLYFRRFFRDFAYRLFKNTSNSLINKMIEKIYKVQQSYLFGLIKVILIVGTLNSIGLLLLGIESAIFFAFFAAFLLVIPYIGIIIGSLLPALVALATKDSHFYALGVICLFGFIQFIEGYFITPKIIGSQVSINPFIAIFSLLAFAMLWGIPGMIVAIPITATLKIFFDYSSNYKAFGFLIGEPEDHFLKSQAKARMKLWKKK